MFNVKESTKNMSADVVAARAKRAKEASVAAAAAAQNAAVAAQNAAQTAAAAAQTAAHEVSNAAQQAAAGMSKGVYSARSWTAPRLESAAEYTTTTVAPRVSSGLRSAARQISPEDMRRKRGSSALTWSFLAAAVLAAAGAVTAIVRQRYRTAMVADTAAETEEGAGGTAATSPAGDATAEGSGTSPDAGVNGRVSTSGR